MTTSFLVFLKVVEELSISKAAKECFVTQQCVSDHIKRLEDEYGTKLFNRRPALSLTPTGKVVYEAILKMKMLEENMTYKIEELKNETKGEIKIGLSSVRAQIIIPNLVKKYKDIYPKVTLSFVLDETKNLEKYLLKGDINLFLGVNTSKNSLFKTEMLGKGNIYFICTDETMEKYCGSQIKKIKKEKIIEAETIKRIPIIGNAKVSNLSGLLDEFFKHKGIELKGEVIIGDGETILRMCELGLGGGFVPTIVLQNVIRYNKNLETNKKIKFYKIKDFNESLNFDIVHYSDIELPTYTKELMKLLKEDVKKIYDVRVENF